jgi:hypothetical protein
MVQMMFQRIWQCIQLCAKYEGPQTDLWIQKWVWAMADNINDTPAGLAQAVLPHIIGTTQLPCHAAVSDL